MVRDHQWCPGASFSFSDDNSLQRDVEGSSHLSSHSAATVTTFDRVLGQLRGSFPGSNTVIANITNPDRLTGAYALFSWLA